MDSRLRGRWTACIRRPISSPTLTAPGNETNQIQRPARKCFLRRQMRVAESDELPVSDCMALFRWRAASWMRFGSRHQFSVSQEPAGPRSVQTNNLRPPEEARWLDGMRRATIMPFAACECSAQAGVAQLVEHHVANVVVEGSSPFTRSFLFPGRSKSPVPR